MKYLKYYSMEVYYTVKCFHCEAGKPTIEDGEGNLIECGNWLENQEEEFATDDFLDILVSMEKLQRNDSYIELNNSNNGEYGRLITIWKKYFPIDIKWFVSW